MRKLAASGQAILCTIHQPSAILFEHFDELILLKSGGRVVYAGELGKDSQTMIKYFEESGADKCPPDANPAEWMLEVIGADHVVSLDQKDGTQPIRAACGSLAAEWLNERDAEKTYRAVSWDKDHETVVCSEWRVSRS